MLRLTIAAVGRSRPGPARTLFDDYVGRCPWPVRLVEVRSTRPEGPERTRDEGSRLLAAVPPEAAVVALDERGRDLTSHALADHLGRLRDGGAREVVFLIGGADGLAGEAVRRADLRLAFGRATWPHMLVRAMLAEQLYRAAAILAGHPYHRE